MANRPISNKEEKAWEFSKSAHKLQVRAFTGLPYFDEHIQKVNGILKLYTSDEDILCASLLHDVIEDCFDDIEDGYEVIKSSFGDKIAKIVLELTSDKNDIKNEYSGDKTAYLIDKMLNMSDDAFLIKLADRYQNISDSFTANERFRKKYFNETKNIIEALKKDRDFNTLQKRILENIEQKLLNIKTYFNL